MLKRNCFMMVVVLCMLGCDAVGQSALIPKQELSSQQKESITHAIDTRNHSALCSFGKAAVPMIIKAVLDIANDPQKSRSVTASSDACNFIRDLGTIRDPRSVPALNHLLKDVKKRTFHPSVADALGRIGDKSAVEALKVSFEREKKYIADGDGKGPDYGWGLANDFAYQVAQSAGTALRSLGEATGDIPKDKMTSMQEEFERMRRSQY